MGKQNIELLAPARNAAIAVEAIKHGADAVYIGAPSHGARAAATNSITDIVSVVEYAHRFNAKVYVTLNTLVYDNELRQVEKLIYELYRCRVDALIVQDMSIMDMDIPPIALHASTQCDIRTPQKARFLQDVGFSQLVLPRELSLSEIAAVRRATTVPLEAFVHGALCVSYSGDCQASLMTTGRSANRGCCAQICRLAYDLEDAEGNTLISNKHLLSLRDMNRASYLKQMIDAGISSFKIEGRLKDMDYVKNIVAFYSQALDRIIEESDGSLRRSSTGRSNISFTPDARKSFNRGFTHYFLTDIDGNRISSSDTPKWIGEPVGTVSTSTGNKIRLTGNTRLNNGDGLGYFNKAGEFSGFRANRVEGSTVFTTSDIHLAPGTRIYRNHDKQWNDLMQGKTASRKIDIDMTLRGNADWVALSALSADGTEITVRADGPFETAKTPQTESRRKNIAKLGDTSYILRQYDDQVPELFIPASLLSQLRRDAMTLLDKAREINYKFDYRRPESTDATLPDTRLTYHDNAANSMARSFYQRHGATEIAPALEIEDQATGSDTVVMTTRYCLRREHDRCRQTPQGTKWPQPLFLKAPGIKFRLDFDCVNCRMKVIKPSNS